MQTLMEDRIIAYKMFLQNEGIYEAEVYLGLATVPWLSMTVYRRMIMLHWLN